MSDHNHAHPEKDSTVHHEHHTKAAPHTASSVPNFAAVDDKTHAMAASAVAAAAEAVKHLKTEVKHAEPAHHGEFTPDQTPGQQKSTSVVRGA